MCTGTLLPPVSLAICNGKNFVIFLLLLLLLLLLFLPICCFRLSLKSCFKYQPFTNRNSLSVRSDVTLSIWRNFHRHKSKWNKKHTNSRRIESVPTSCPTHMVVAHANILRQELNQIWAKFDEIPHRNGCCFFSLSIFCRWVSLIYEYAIIASFSFVRRLALVQPCAECWRGCLCVCESKLDDDHDDWTGANKWN